jgi:hypothetical protein
MGSASSKPPIPELGEPKIDLAPSRVATVRHESGPDVDIAYRVFREELKVAENGGVVV